MFSSTDFESTFQKIAAVKPKPRTPLRQPAPPQGVDRSKAKWWMTGSCEECGALCAYQATLCFACEKSRRKGKPRSSRSTTVSNAERQLAFQQGAADCQRGKRVDAVPYSHPVKAAAWEEGWRQQKRRMMEAAK